MITADTPYEAAALGLWAVLKANGRFNSMVKNANCITFMGDDRDPIINNPTEANFPQVRLVLQSTVGFRWSSSSVFEELQFAIQFSTGDQRLTHTQFKLRYAVLCAMVSAHEIMCRDVVFGPNSERIVRKVQPTAAIDVKSDAELERTIPGWHGLWTVNITLEYSNALLR